MSKKLEQRAELEQRQRKFDESTEAEKQGIVKRDEVGAYAEKPIRDFLSRTQPSDKGWENNLKDLANRKGEIEMTKFSEKRKYPGEVLFERLNDIASELVEKKMEKDAEIVMKLIERAQRYVDVLEQQTNIHFVGDGVPVTHITNQNGGAAYSADGDICEKWNSQDDFERDKELIVNSAQSRPIPNTAIRVCDIVNYKFSEEAENIFCRMIGAIGNNESVSDIPTKQYNRIGGSKHGPGAAREYGYDVRIYNKGGDKNISNFSASIPTNISGIFLDITKTPKHPISGQKEDNIMLNFSDALKAEFIRKKHSRDRKV